jgi:hypothetical protein
VVMLRPGRYKVLKGEVIGRRIGGEDIQDGVCGHLQRTRYTSNAVHPADDTHIARALSQRNSARNNEDGSAEDTSSTHTGNRAADDESGRVRRNTADQRADLEDKERSKVDPFYTVKRIEFAVEELRGARSEQV